MIEIKDLELVINKSVILKNINLSFEDGHIYGIVGRNGCGKTMLLRVICGFIRPTKGTVSISGSSSKVSAVDSGQIGMIIENPGFIPDRSGYANLKFLAGLRGEIKDDEIKEAIRMVGLDPDSKKKVGKYSLGMRQRLALAQAFMENQQILCLDEPFNGLDEEGVATMRELLLRFKKEGRLIIIVSHSREDIDYLCDVKYHMSKGEIDDIL